jgi:ribosomal protein L37AE/L43A
MNEHRSPDRERPVFDPTVCPRCDCNDTIRDDEGWWFCLSCIAAWFLGRHS